MAPVASEAVTLAAADGRALSARYWPGAEAARRSVVLLSGLAAPQGYLRPLAGYLADKGWGVLTFDYRSVGASRDRVTDEAVTADDWVNRDLPAAVAEIRRRANPEFLAVLAHSIGGQLFGQSPIRREVSGALFVAAQRGIPRLYSGSASWRVHYAYAVFPLLIRLLGRLPVSSVTLPEACSGQVLLQWVRWGKSGVFTDMQGENVEARFAEYEGPLIAVTVADDLGYASPPAVEALTRVYTRALVRRETVDPKDYGVQSIGHFGLFNPRAPRALWARLEGWLRDLEKAKSRGSFEAGS